MDNIAVDRVLLIKLHITVRQNSSDAEHYFAV